MNTEQQGRKYIQEAGNVVPGYSGTDKSEQPNNERQINALTFSNTNVADTIAATNINRKADGRSQKGRWWLTGEAEILACDPYTNTDEYGYIFRSKLQLRRHRAGPTCVVIISWIGRDDNYEPCLEESIFECDDILSCTTVGEVEDILLAGIPFGEDFASFYDPSKRANLAAMLTVHGITDEEAGL